MAVEGKNLVTLKYVSMFLVSNILNIALYSLSALYNKFPYSSFFMSIPLQMTSNAINFRCTIIHFL